VANRTTTIERERKKAGGKENSNHNTTEWSGAREPVKNNKMV